MILEILVVIVVVWVAQTISPFWWWVMAIPLLYSLCCARSAMRAFWIGFLSAGLVWLIQALIQLQSGASKILAKIADMVTNSPENDLTVIAFMIIIISVAGGVAAWAGFLLGNFFKID